MLRFFDRNADRVAAFAHNELDVMLFPGRQFDSEQAAAGGGQLYATTTNTIVQFVMNLVGTHCSHWLLSARRSLLQFDRRALVREIEGPSGLAAFSPVGPLSDAFEPNVNEHPLDLNQVKSLLAGEGWTRQSDGLLHKNGEPFKFAVMFPPDRWNYDLEAYAIGIREFLLRVGIDMEVRPVEYWTGMKPAWRSQDFEAFIYYDTFYVEPDLFWSYHSSMPRRPSGDGAPAGLPHYGYGVSGYRNATVDALLEADPARRTCDHGRSR